MDDVRDDDVRDLDDAQLLNSLDWNRSVVVRKLEGLTLEQATQLVTPSGLTLLGVVRHLAWCERGWFGHFLLGESDEGVDDDATSFSVKSASSVEEVISGYLAAIERSREIVREQPSLEVRSVLPHDYFGFVTLRWILLHMATETTRHAGHLDILRELTDGQTGY
ncbi:MAG: DinB family protein [Ilumatobacteraceae bacterium]|nr:DinB family protein [Ilumatobacteraceae bacterium]